VLADAQTKLFKPTFQIAHSLKNLHGEAPLVNVWPDQRDEFG
jgi:hypothetical protein